ncbi:MAG TPA: hypothetical protein VNE82_01510 [Candidatus Binataceae bacterium]|nr:hypothetical protein [Candidatus Binataceae bacterium]
MYRRSRRIRRLAGLHDRRFFCFTDIPDAASLSQLVWLLLVYVLTRATSLLAASLFHRHSRRASDVGACTAAAAVFADSRDFTIAGFLASPTLSTPSFYALARVVRGRGWGEGFFTNTSGAAPLSRLVRLGFPEEPGQITRHKDAARDPSTPAAFAQDDPREKLRLRSRARCAQDDKLLSVTNERLH